MLAAIEQYRVKKLIAVMGGGVNADGGLPKHVSLRCDKAIEMLDEDSVIVASSSHTMNIPPKLDLFGHIKSEATAIFNSIKLKNPQAMVVCEQFSHDTIGSVFFIQELYARYMCSKEIVYITSDFHVERVEYIANFIASLNGAFVARTKVIGVQCDIDSRSRRGRELESLATIEREWSLIKSVDELFVYLVTSHDNYNNKYGSVCKDFEGLLY